MQVYEVGYLILPSIAEEKLNDVVAKIRGVFEKAGGKELDGETPYLQPLAYTMSKTLGASRYVVNEAYLGWMKFELEPELISRVGDQLKEMQEILRLLLIKAPRKTTFTFAKAKALLAEKEAKEADANREDSPTEAPVIE